jgi:hypothetical protein
MPTIVSILQNIAIDLELYSNDLPDGTARNEIADCVRRLRMVIAQIITPGEVSPK